MMINLERKSPRTGKVNSMDLITTKKALDEYYGGTSARYVQDIFPNLTSDEREFIMTGYTPEDWDELFGEED
tara:strand:- start:226 stop:441 length:216 start_codon:yes stop_codon:yes gene_type:complete